MIELVSLVLTTLLIGIVLGYILQRKKQQNMSVYFETQIPLDRLQKNEGEKDE